MKMFKGNILSPKFLAIDIETTCLDPSSSTAGIIEVYAGIYTKQMLTDKYHELFYHENSDDTYEFHRIDKNELINKPKFINADISVLKDALLECCSPESNLTLMAYYAPFEYKWLSKFTGIDFSHLRVCDPRLIYKEIDPNVEHNLRYAAKTLCNLTPNGSWAFHRSKDDVSAMVQVYTRLLEEISDCDLEEYSYDTYRYVLEEHLHERERPFKEG